MTTVVIPIFKQDKPEELKVDVPSNAENLFERIIRDPTNLDRPARETRCAEMLCALLLNCETLKLQFLEQFAAMFGWDNLPLAELEYDIETEQAIGSKRDDLRIEGYRVNDEDREQVLLWTIEIKVQAGLHQSSYQGYEDIPPPDEVDDSVPQIENYDRWLTSQSVSHKGGIVLAIPNLQSEVEELNTANQWRCLRWSDLATWVESTLEKGTLPLTEQLFAEHFLGFVWNNLRDSIEMSKDQLGIDDIALIRAFNIKGDACEKKVNRLIESLFVTLKESGITLYSDPKHTKSLFSTMTRSMAHARLLPDEAIKPSPSLSLMVGMKEDDAEVMIESSRGCPWKSQFRKICQERESALKERNPDWEFVGDDSSWIEISLRKPLTWLLIEEDQSAALQEFVKAGIEDLKAVGLIDALQAIPTNLKESQDNG